MRNPPVLTKGVIKVIHESLDNLFSSILHRFLNKPPTKAKQIIFKASSPPVTFIDLFNTASAEERNVPDKGLLDNLLGIVEGYIEIQRQQAKTRVVHAVSSWLKDAYSKGVKTDVETVLGGELAEILGKTTSDMKRIVETESNNIKNTGTLDAIIKINAANGVEDPICYFVVVRDGDLCSECKRLHLMPNGIEPRLWKLSEIKHGYHSKEDDVPSLGGEHPSCRCSLVTMLDSYGFDEKGSITYVGMGHSELKKQRG